MSNNKTLHYYLIADASGSMHDQIVEVRQELNKHLLILRESAQKYGTQVLFSLLTFDGQCDWIYAHCPIHKVNTITTNEYDSGGVTALYDAVAEGIRAADKNVWPSFKAQSDRVQISIYSDGGENASRFTNSSTLKELINHHQSLPGWTIDFFGCEPTSFVDMQNSGLSKDFIHAYNADHKAGVFSQEINECAMRHFEPSKSDEDIIF
jgi:hypothetical protein